MTALRVCLFYSQAVCKFYETNKYMFITYEYLWWSWAGDMWVIVIRSDCVSWCSRVAKRRSYESWSLSLESHLCHELTRRRWPHLSFSPSASVLPPAIWGNNTSTYLTAGVENLMPSKCGWISTFVTMPSPVSKCVHFCVLLYFRFSMLLRKCYCAIILL